MDFFFLIVLDFLTDWILNVTEQRKLKDDFKVFGLSIYQLELPSTQLERFCVQQTFKRSVDQFWIC